MVGSVTRIRRNPAVACVLGVVVELQLVEPLQVEGEAAALAVQLDAQRRSCGRTANRVASKEASAPEPSRAVNSAASSTVTGPGARSPSGQRPLGHEGALTARTRR